MQWQHQGRCHAVGVRPVLDLERCLRTRETKRLLPAPVCSEVDARANDGNTAGVVSLRVYFDIKAKKEIIRPPNRTYGKPPYFLFSNDPAVDRDAHDFPCPLT